MISLSAAATGIGEFPAELTQGFPSLSYTDARGYTLNEAA